MKDFNKFTYTHILTYTARPVVLCRKILLGHGFSFQVCITDSLLNTISQCQSHYKEIKVYICTQQTKDHSVIRIYNLKDHGLL